MFNYRGGVTVFQKKSFPIKYLGCVLFNGRKKIDFFSDLLGKYKKRVAG